MARACNCGAAKAKIVAAALARNNAERRLLVTCTDCHTSLKTSEGAYLPVHVVPVAVSEATVALWREQGYVLEITPL